MSGEKPSREESDPKPTPATPLDDPTPIRASAILRAVNDRVSNLLSPPPSSSPARQPPNNQKREREALPTAEVPKEELTFPLLQVEVDAYSRRKALGRALGGWRERVKIRKIRWKERVGAEARIQEVKMRKALSRWAFWSKSQRNLLHIHSKVLKQHRKILSRSAFWVWRHALAMCRKDKLNLRKGGNIRATYLVRGKIQHWRRLRKQSVGVRRADNHSRERIITKAWSVWRGAAPAIRTARRVGERLRERQRIRVVSRLVSEWIRVTVRYKTLRWLLLRMFSRRAIRRFQENVRFERSLEEKTCLAQKAWRLKLLRMSVFRWSIALKCVKFSRRREHQRLRLILFRAISAGRVMRVSREARRRLFELRNLHRKQRGFSAFLTLLSARRIRTKTLSRANHNRCLSLLRSSISRWRVELRGHVLRDTRVRREIFRQFWMWRLAFIGLTKGRDRVLTRGIHAWHRFIDNKKMKRRRIRTASLQWRLWGKRRVFNGWTRALDIQRERERHLKNHAYPLKLLPARFALQKWRQALSLRREFQENYSRAEILGNLSAVARVLKRWRERARILRDEEKSFRTALSMSTRLRARAFLYIWRAAGHHAARRKSEQEQIADFQLRKWSIYRYKKLFANWLTLYSNRQQDRGLQERAKQYFRYKGVRRSIQLWLEFSRKSTRITVKLDRYRQRKHSKLKADAMRRWHVSLEDRRVELHKMVAALEHWRSHMIRHHLRTWSTYKRTQQHRRNKMQSKLSFRPLLNPTPPMQKIPREFSENGGIPELKEQREGNPKEGSRDNDKQLSPLSPETAAKIREIEKGLKLGRYNSRPPPRPLSFGSHQAQLNQKTLFTKSPKKKENFSPEKFNLSRKRRERGRHRDSPYRFPSIIKTTPNPARTTKGYRNNQSALPGIQKEIRNCVFELEELLAAKDNYTSALRQLQRLRREGGSKEHIEHLKTVCARYEARRAKVMPAVEELRSVVGGLLIS
ncbi:hypothetical protein AAMO2058_001222100 [Amorphochlora amoebiformis]